MKNIKFLICGLLMATLSFSVSAYSDVKKNPEVETVKLQTHCTVATPICINSVVVMPEATIFVPSFTASVPQTPSLGLLKSPIYANVVKRNYNLQKPVALQYKNSGPGNLQERQPSASKNHLPDVIAGQNSKLSKHKYSEPWQV